MATHNEPHTLILTREIPEDVFALLNYKGRDRWILNGKMTTHLARSLKRQSKGKIKITDSGKKIHALGIKESDVDYITEIENKPMFKIASGKAIHILGKISYKELGEYIDESNKLWKDKKLDRSTKNLKDARSIDTYVDILQDDINHNTNKLNVEVGDIVAFNYNGKSRGESMYDCIVNGGRQGAGRVVGITKTGITINEFIALTESGDYRGNVLAFTIKTEKRHIKFTRILSKENENYLPKDKFFTWLDTPINFS